MRLGSPREPVWLQMLHGASWLVNVHDTLAVEGYGRKRAQVLDRLGRPEDPDELIEAEARADLEASVWLARRTVVEWREVTWDDTGEPAPCEPDLVEQAIREQPVVGATFRNGLFQALSAWGLEKKGSATSPRGTGTAPPSAGAAPATPPAAGDGSAAPTSPRDRAARRAGRSGSSSSPAPASSGGP